MDNAYFFLAGILPQSHRFMKRNNEAPRHEETGHFAGLSWKTL